MVRLLATMELSTRLHSLLLPDFCESLIKYEPQTLEFSLHGISMQVLPLRYSWNDLRPDTTSYWLVQFVNTWVWTKAVCSTPGSVRSCLVVGWEF
mmetsp:Transcript_11040/g.33108  ORF Transcript_11040/g.33108 Transcript_11040/m.33108 type:complete len:95 (+) Transcript_11040:1293-1577(+)